MMILRALWLSLRVQNIMSSAASRQLEIFDNPCPERDYLIHMEIPEFTCLCPLTGQPDFATLILDYIPDEKNLELKALKLYMWSFRNEGHFHEDVTNRILSDFVEKVNPRFMRLEARWWVRGGIYTTVRAEHRKEGWQPQPEVTLPAFPENSPMRSI